MQSSLGTVALTTASWALLLQKHTLTAKLYPPSHTLSIQVYSNRRRFQPCGFDHSFFMEMLSLCRRHFVTVALVKENYRINGRRVSSLDIFTSSDQHSNGSVAASECSNVASWPFDRFKSSACEARCLYTDALEYMPTYIFILAASL